MNLSNMDHFSVIWFLTWMKNYSYGNTCFISPIG